MAIRVGNVSGNNISIGNHAGPVADTRGFASVKAGGVDVKFQPGADLKSRQVVIEGVANLTLAQGTKLKTTVNGVEVRAQDNRLWVNKHEVKFTDSKPAAKDSVDPKRAATPTPSEVKVVQDNAHSAAQVQSKRASTLFGVSEPVAQRSDVKQLLTGSRVTGQDISKLLAAGVSAKEINKELVKNGSGPLANLLTPEAMKTLLKDLSGQQIFLKQASEQLPSGVSVKMAEDRLAEREGGVSSSDQIQELVNKGFSPQEATRQLLATLSPEPVTTNVLRAPEGAKPPIAAALLDNTQSAQLKELLKIPAFKSVFLGTTNQPVGASEMQQMLNAVGPEGLKTLGSAVVFGSGGISDRITPEAMNTFLQAVHTASGGATAGGVPANAYGNQTLWQGPAATAQQPLQFLQDPGMQYIAQTYGNNWGSVAASAALSLTAGNLMPYANNFMYGNTMAMNPMVMNPTAYATNLGYNGYGLYNPGMYPRMSTGHMLGNIAGTLIGSAVGGALMGGVSSLLGGGFGGWGGGYGGCYGMGGCWGLGNSMWNSYPGNMFGFNMMSSGFGYASSFW